MNSIKLCCCAVICVLHIRKPCSAIIVHGECKSAEVEDLILLFLSSQAGVAGGRPMKSTKGNAEVPKQSNEQCSPSRVVVTLVLKTPIRTLVENCHFFVVERNHCNLLWSGATFNNQSRIINGNENFGTVVRITRSPVPQSVH